MQVTTFRGFMFLESADHEWYNWGGTGLCMPRIALDWLPRVFFRRGAQLPHMYPCKHAPPETKPGCLEPQWQCLSLLHAG